MADKAISLEQFKEALKAIRNSTISEPDLSVRFVENAPDWNALEDEAGYIKNRPFGYRKNVVIPEANYTFEMNEDVGMPIALVEAPFFDIDDTLIRGLEFTVIYNGIKYDYVYNGNALGNLGAIGEGDDTGEPFLIVTANPAIIIPLDGSTSAKVSMFCKEIVSLPDKYTQDIPTVDLIELGAPTYTYGNDYRFQLDDETRNKFIEARAKRGVICIRLSIRSKYRELDSDGTTTLSSPIDTLDETLIMHATGRNRNNEWFGMYGSYMLFCKITNYTIFFTMGAMSFVGVT